MKKIAMIGVVVLSVFVLAACKTKQSSSSNQQPQNQQSTAIQTEGATIITVSDSGFSPAEVTVKSGATITWVNDSSNIVQIGSDPHPIHTTNKELTNGQFILEAPLGGSASAKVTKVGTWSYHNHRALSMRGKVIVE